MTVIIRISKDGPVFNKLTPSDDERKQALDLHNKLKTLIPDLEKEYEKGKIETKRGFRVDDKIPRLIGEKLRKVLCDEYNVTDEELDWVFKAIKEIYSTQGAINVSQRRDILKYMFEAAKLPLAFYSSIGWDGWRRLMDSPTVRKEKRFLKWLEKKYNKEKGIQKGFMRDFIKETNAILNNRDTFIFTDDNELFAIYDKAWDITLKKKIGKKEDK